MLSMIWSAVDLLGGWEWVTGFAGMGLTALGAVWTRWKWVLIVTGLAAVAITILVLLLAGARKDTTIARLEGDVARISAELSEAVRVNAHNSETIRRLTVAEASAAAARDAAVAIAAERKVEVVTRTNTIIKEVERETAEDECPVAPSLRAALAGLREFGAARRDRDGVPGRAPPATGAPVRLRPAPAAAEP